MNVIFEEEFRKGIKKHSAIKERVRKKVDAIIQHPTALGEPLRANFRGYYSCSVKKSFIIIYLYCKDCRSRGDVSHVGCPECDSTPDDTIKFIRMTTHDEAYGK